MCQKANIVFIVGQLYFKRREADKLIDKEIWSVGTRSRRWGGGKLDEGSQKDRLLIIEVKKYYECDAQHDKIINISLHYK